MQTSYWLILFVILLIIEILTMGLTTIWFAGGALAAFLAGMLGEDIDTLHATGMVEVRGQDWSAKTKEPDGRIAKDTVVTIEEIQGVHLIVKPREEQTC